MGMADLAVEGEETYVQNGFGIVTSRRVVYFRSKGWMTGGSREDIPLQHVTSVRRDTARSVLGGSFLVLIGLCMLAGPVGLKILGLLILSYGILLLWGSPLVVVNTAGRDLNAAKGWPWDRPHAEAFVVSLRDQLFKKNPQ